MTSEILARGLGLGRTLFRKAMAKIKRSVVQGQLEHLEITTSSDGLIPKEDSMGGEGSPQFAYLDLRFENLSDIHFDIASIDLWIEVSASGVPERRKRTPVPVARIRETSDTLADRDIGWINGHDTRIGSYDSASNVSIYNVEFTIPSWVQEIERVYINGCLRVQLDQLKRFEVRLDSTDVRNTD